MSQTFGAFELNTPIDAAAVLSYVGSSETATDEIRKISPNKWSSEAAHHLAMTWKSINLSSNSTNFNASKTIRKDAQNSAQTSFSTANPPKSVKVPSISKEIDRRPSLQPIQEWEGYVTEINAKMFTARLVDVTSRETVEQEQGQFPLFDVSDSDRPQLEVGAVFRWIIGYSRSASGAKSRTSRIVFRKRPAFSQFDLNTARERAKRLVDNIEWE